MFGKILNIISKIAEILASILLAAMCCLVFTNVVCRYLLHFSIPWSEEMSRFLQIWVVFIGTALVYQENGHMGLDILVKALPKQVARLIAVIVDCMVLYVTYLIGYGSLELTVQMHGWTTPAAGISFSWKFGIVVFSMALMAIFALIKLYWHIVSLIKNKDLPAKPEKLAHGGDNA